MLLAKKGKALREQLDAQYAASTDYAEYEKAMSIVRKLLFEEAKYLLGSAKSLRSV